MVSGDERLTLIAHLAGLIQATTQMMDRDGMANSLGHKQRIEKCARAIENLAEGREAELPI